MNFKTKRRYKFLFRFFLVLFMLSSFFSLAGCYYAIENAIELGDLIPFYIIGIIIMLISMNQHFKFLNKRDAYRKNVILERQKNWQKVIIEMIDIGNVNDAIKLFNRLNFKSESIRNHLIGYISCSTKQTKI